MSKSVIKIISTKQCKRARALLKWNPLDLASRTRIPVKHLEKFERNQVRLTKPENDEVVKVFERHKIEFLADGEVMLHGGGEEYHYSGKDFKHYDLAKDDTKAVEDLPPDAEALARAVKEEEEKRLKREREEAERRKKQGN